MIQIAWEWLAAHGTLTNRWLLDKDGLNVKRLSFVCALLARLPRVEVVSRRPAIELALGAHRRPQASSLAGHQTPWLAATLTLCVGERSRKRTEAGADRLGAR